MSRSAALRLGFAILAVAALLAGATVTLAPAQQQQVTLQLYDAEGEPLPERTRAQVERVDFSAETVTLRTDLERREVAFIRIDEEDLYRLVNAEADRLSTEAQRNPELQAEAAYAHLVAARLCIGRGSLVSAQRHLDQAERHDADGSLTDQLEWEHARRAELRAEEMLREARRFKNDEGYDHARRVLDRLLRRYGDTSVADEARELMAVVVELRELAEQSRDRRRRDRNGRADDDPLEAVRVRLAAAEQRRREGHNHAAEQRVSHAYNHWREAIQLIYADRNSAARLLERAIERDRDGALDDAEIGELQQGISELRLELYKTMIHFRLMQGIISEPEEYLNQALDLAPDDRELLHLHVLLYSAKRWGQGEQVHDKPEPEEDPEEPVDPNRREPDDPRRQND